MKKTVGLIVNPVAGMGGSVGLKGTDGAMYEKAVELGAEPVTPGRTRTLLEHIEHKEDITFLAAPDRMGECYLTDLPMSCTVVGEIDEETSPGDTRRIAREMVQRGAELLVFVGGDGTVRDIYDAVGTEVPVVGVPSGVKVFSAAFAVSARGAAELVDAFIEGAEVTEQEVLDIDEEAFREDRLDSRLYGYLLVPEAPRFQQPGKSASDVSRSSAERKQEIAAYIVEEMEPEVLYLLGPGTSLRAITDELDLPKTLLGVDAVRDGALVGEDVNESDILQLFERYERREIIVTPIGGNGFIFGRGSKQFTPEVIRGTGRENILVVATREKLADLECLRVDTGDREVDELLSGVITVSVGYRHEVTADVVC